MPTPPQFSHGIYKQTTPPTKNPATPPPQPPPPKHRNNYTNCDKCGIGFIFLRPKDQIYPSLY